MNSFWNFSSFLSLCFPCPLLLYLTTSSPPTPSAPEGTTMPFQHPPGCSLSNFMKGKYELAPDLEQVLHLPVPSVSSPVNWGSFARWPSSSSRNSIFSLGAGDRAAPPSPFPPSGCNALLSCYDHVYRDLLGLHAHVWTVFFLVHSLPLAQNPRIQLLTTYRLFQRSWCRFKV